MEFGPIFRSMTRNKIGVGLLILEVAFTMAIVLNCVAMIRDNKARLSIETGLAEDEIFIINVEAYDEAFTEFDYRRQVFKQDISWLESQSGVKAVTHIGPVPLIGGGSSNQRIAEGASEATAVRCPNYRVGPDFLDAMGLQLEAGRTFTRDDMDKANAPREDGVDPPPREVLITRDLADAIYPDGDALGKIITSTNGRSRDLVIGIVSYMYTPYDNGASGMETRILFYTGFSQRGTEISYLVRAEPDAYNELFTRLESEIPQQTQGRVAVSRSLAEYKAGGSFFGHFVIKLLTVLMVLLLVLTAMGIYGLTSFSVSARTKQIGTRRALGATRADIVRYFLLENSLISLIGITLGLVLAWLLNKALLGMMPMIRPLDLGLMFTGVAVLWGIGVFSTLLPALRGAAIPPVIATRTA